MGRGSIQVPGAEARKQDLCGREIGEWGVEVFKCPELRRGSRSCTVVKLENGARKELRGWVRE